MQRNSFFKNASHSNFSDTLSKLISSMRQSILGTLLNEDTFFSDTKIGLLYEFEPIQLAMTRKKNFNDIEMLLYQIKEELDLHIKMVPMKKIIDGFLKIACCEYNKEDFIKLLDILKPYQSGIDDPNYAISHEVFIVSIDISSSERTMPLFKYITRAGNIELTKYFLDKGVELNEARKSELIASH